MIRLPEKSTAEAAPDAINTKTAALGAIAFSKYFFIKLVLRNIGILSKHFGVVINLRSYVEFLNLIGFCRKCIVRKIMFRK